MRVAIDCTAVVFGGGVTWMREFVPRLCGLSSDDHFTILVKPDFNWISGLLPQNCETIELSFPPRFQSIWRLVWQQLILPFWLKRKRIDCLISPYDTAPLFSATSILLGIQNASPYWGPPASTLRERVRLWFIRWLSRMSARKAGRIFFVSGWARADIGEMLGLPKEKTSVVYNGVSEIFKPGNSAREELPIILAVGSVYVYKDYLSLIDALGELVKRGYDDLRLVIAGGIFDQPYYQELTVRIETLGLAGQVEFVNTHLQDEIVGLYQSASVMVLPTQVETFGFPLVEAMACGVPVVTSDLPVTREVCGEAALYYTLGDVDSLVRGIQYILDDEQLKSDLVERGLERAKDFSWTNSAQQVSKLINSLPGK